MAKVSKTALAKELIQEFNMKLSQGMKKLSRAELEDIGHEIVFLMQADIQKGISPIAGAGRFPPYKDPDKYPGKRNSALRKRFPGKKTRPVDLFLSGDFLISLLPFTKTNWFKDISGRSGYSLFIGFKNKLSKQKESGHREGVNGQPERPIIPNEGEKFAKKFGLLLKDSLITAINKKLAK